MLNKKYFTTLILVFICLGMALYFHGLKGPFLYDDTHNLKTLIELKSIDSFEEVVQLSLSNNSGPLGRSVSMASFVIQKYLGDFETYDLKLLNLTFHILITLLIFLFVYKITVLLSENAQQSYQTAFLVSLIWLVHPLHVSTVLYIIQRMAQLSTLFSMMALTFFVYNYRRLAIAKSLVTFILPTFFIVATTTLAIFSKENAILIFPSLLLLTWLLKDSTKHSNYFKTWLLVIATIPIIVAAYKFSIFAFNANYEFKGFTLAERLLTQSRVISDYIIQLVFPLTHKMTLYHDDFLKSSSLIQPISTLVASFFIVALACCCFIKSVPRLVRFGIAWFFIWHLIESTVLPLHLYFEHRNYLPSVGLTLVIVHYLITIKDKLTSKTKYIPIILYTVFLSISTYNLTSLWSNKEELYNHWLTNHPTSKSTLITYLQVVEKKYR